MSASIPPIPSIPDWFARMHQRLDAIERAADELRKRDRRPDRISPAAALLIEGILRPTPSSRKTRVPACHGKHPSRMLDP
jgi:hypothetical protein